jgi:hypothetical protein
MAMSMKMVVFWDVVPCSLLDTEHLRAYCLHCQADNSLKRKSISTTLQGATSNKTAIFKCTSIQKSCGDSVLQLLLLDFWTLSSKRSNKCL